MTINPVARGSVLPPSGEVAASRPKVSVLIPTFNQNLQLLSECVESCINQNYDNLEIVISDNHSTNGASALLLSMKDSRLTVVKPQRFLSMNENFAFCANNSSGDYLSFLSSDDALLPGAIETLVAALVHHPQACFAFGNIYYGLQVPRKDSCRASLRPLGNGSWTIVPMEAARNFFFPWTIKSTWMVGNLIRRDAYVSCGGFERCTLEISGDVWLTSELIRRGGFIYTDSPLALFRARELGHVEADPDRRLREFVDTITLREGVKPTPILQVRDILVVLYRLGADSRMLDCTKVDCANKFVELGRSDLARMVRFSLRAPRTVRCVSRLLSLPKALRDLLRLKRIQGY